MQWLQKKGFSEKKAEEELARMMSRPKISQNQIEALTKQLLENNIPIAYHDVDNPNKVDEIQQLGMTICEFPINMETARRATELGLFVVGGAANILRGGSTGGNLVVEDAVKQGYMNTLCSDYYPPSIIHSIFYLADKGLVSLCDAVNMATLHPAQAACIDKQTRSIEIGKYADLVLVDEVQGKPYIRKVLVKGNIVGEYSFQSQKQTEQKNNIAEHILFEN